MSELVNNYANAQFAFVDGCLTECEDICREILANDERFAGAWNLMSRMAALNGDFETAGDFASVACELEPQNAEFTLGLGEVFLLRKEVESAEQAARRALELEPESVKGLVLLGRVLAEKGEQEMRWGRLKRLCGSRRTMRRQFHIAPWRCKNLGGGRMRFHRFARRARWSLNQWSIRRILRRSLSRTNAMWMRWRRMARPHE